MEYKHLFFDLDRTLWDYEANATKALTEIFKEFELHNYFSDSLEFIKLFNLNNDLLWDLYGKGEIKKEELRLRRFRHTLPENNDASDILADQIGAYYMNIISTLNILSPNTISTLNYLTKKNYSLYILTNGFIRTQKEKLVNAKIISYFKRIYSSEEIKINKPQKEIFHWAITSTNARKSECLMIGDDMLIDIQGAMQYGIDAIWFNPQNAQSEYVPTHIISDLIELQNIL